MTPAQFRALALSMPEAVEGAHHGHPDFRVHGRVFASLHADGERGMVKVPPDEQRRLLSSHGGIFAAAAGAWGRAGCTMVTLRAATRVALDGPMAAAWQAAHVLAAAKTANRKRAPAKRRRR